MKYLKVWTDFESVLSPLDDAEAGRLFRLMLRYARDGEEPEEFVGNEAYLWPAAKRDIDMTAERNETLRQNGLKGGRPKTKENQSEPNETKENQTKAEKKRKETKGNEKAKTELLFARFWDAYPRKVGKPDARKKFDSLDPDEALLETMLQSIEKWKGSAQWQDPQYIPHPSTWLNQRRWEDEPAAAGRKVISAQAYTQRSYDNEQEEAEKRFLQQWG